MPPQGYAHPAYAAALAKAGEPLSLTHSGGWLIRRPIPGEAAFDAAAPYPFLACRDWSGLAADIAALPPDIVSLVAVTDPFAGVGERQLAAAFNRFAKPYKPHFIVDLARPLEDFADPHTLGCARRALKKIAVECCAAPLAHFNDWLALYAVLAARHGLRGEGLMTAASLRQQFAVPGFRLFRAIGNGETLGMIAVMESGEDAYFHLGAYTAAGYRLKASYALVRGVIAHYREAGFRRMSIGAGAGAFGSGDDGLTAFKRGWSSGTAMTWICGHVIDWARYMAFTERRNQHGSTYFPAYRAGEFD